MTTTVKLLGTEGGADCQLNDMVHHPKHYNQHAVECQDFRRMLPAPLADAAKYRWREGDKFSAEEDRQKMIWYIKDYLTHLDQFFLITEDTTARMAAQIAMCQETMADECAHDLMMIVFLAGGQREAVSDWLSELTGIQL